MYNPKDTLLFLKLQVESLLPKTSEPISRSKRYDDGKAELRCCSQELWNWNACCIWKIIIDKMGGLHSGPLLDIIL